MKKTKKNLEEEQAEEKDFVLDEKETVEEEIVNLDPDVIVKADHVVKAYPLGEGSFNAIDDVNFEIKEGEFVIILGPSGAGKTTLLNLMGGMDVLTTGSLYVGGKDLGKLKKKELTTYRRNDVGFIFQFYNLMPNLTAKENIELAVELCSDALTPVDVLSDVGLSERVGSFPALLSGGEQQRVSIARAIAKNPKILLCDEPTGALDYETGKKILKLLHDTSRANKKTIIIVTHNAALKEMADKVIILRNGKVDMAYINDDPKDVSEIEW